MTVQTQASVAGNVADDDLPARRRRNRIAMPFNSTTHFHTMVALEQAKIDPKDVQILNMRPPEVRAAWQRGDIQATWIWDPVLSEVKKDGKVILTSGKVSADTGKATFDGYIVNKDWAKQKMHKAQNRADEAADAAENRAEEAREDAKAKDDNCGCS